MASRNTSSRPSSTFWPVNPWTPSPGFPIARDGNPDRHALLVEVQDAGKSRYLEDLHLRRLNATQHLRVGTDIKVPELHTYAEGEPMPVVFGELADDDMCNMFGYFINQADLSKLP